MAGAAVAYGVAWYRRGRVVDAPHVRLQVVHEGASAGDVTLEGLQTREYRDRAGQRWLVLRDATMLEPDEGVQTLAGETHIPAARVIFRQTLVDVRVGPIEVRG